MTSRLTSLVSLTLGTAVALLAAGAAHAQTSVCGDDPEKGDFTLDEATKGLKGAKTAPLTATIETTMGTFTCELNEKKSPVTVANFAGLARGVRPWCDEKSKKWEKKPFYDSLIFHRVIANFMIQGGDPLGVGRGGPGYKFKNESDPGLLFDKPGVLAMANAGRDTNGSQFFITEAPQPALNGGYTIFGQCDPVSLVGQIARVPRNGEKPVTDVVMKKVTIARGKPGKAAKAEKGEAKGKKEKAADAAGGEKAKAP
jgi:peptidyl-prolyl cis-trans isomerase A (cyclophilin A)